MAEDSNILNELLSAAGQEASSVSNQIEGWVQGSLSVEDVFKKPLVTQEQIDSLSSDDKELFDKVKEGVVDKFAEDTSILEKWAAKYDGITPETGANTIAFIVVENGRKAKDNGISFLIDAVQEKAAKDGWGEALLSGLGALADKVVSYFSDKEPDNELLTRSTEMAIKSASLDNGRVLSSLMDSKYDALKIAQSIEESAIKELGIEGYKSVFTEDVLRKAEVLDARNESRAVSTRNGNRRGKIGEKLITDASAAELDKNIQDITDDYRDGLLEIGYTDKQAVEAANALYKTAISSSPYIKNGDAYSEELSEYLKLANYGGIRDKAMVLSDDARPKVKKASESALDSALKKIASLQVNVEGESVIEPAIDKEKLQSHKGKLFGELADNIDNAMHPQNKQQARHGRPTDKDGKEKKEGSEEEKVMTAGASRRHAENLARVRELKKKAEELKEGGEKLVAVADASDDTNKNPLVTPTNGKEKQILGVGGA